MTSIQQRELLQSQIWKIANEVRGAVDGWDFKQFVLGTLFYRLLKVEMIVLIMLLCLIALSLQKLKMMQ